MRTVVIMRYLTGRKRTGDIGLRRDLERTLERKLEGFKNSSKIPNLDRAFYSLIKQNPYNLNQDIRQILKESTLSEVKSKIWTEMHLSSVLDFHT